MTIKETYNGKQNASSYSQEQESEVQKKSKTQSVSSVISPSSSDQQSQHLTEPISQSAKNQNTKSINLAMQSEKSLVEPIEEYQSMMRTEQDSILKKDDTPNNLSSISQGQSTIKLKSLTVAADQQPHFVVEPKLDGQTSYSVKNASLKSSAQVSVLHQQPPQVIEDILMRLQALEMANQNSEEPKIE